MWAPAASGIAPPCEVGDYRWRDFEVRSPYRMMPHCDILVFSASGNAVNGMIAGDQRDTLSTPWRLS